MLGNKLIEKFETMDNGGIDNRLSLELNDSDEDTFCSISSKGMRSYSFSSNLIYNIYFFTIKDYVCSLKILFITEYLHTLE